VNKPASAALPATSGVGPDPNLGVGWLDRIGIWLNRRLGPQSGDVRLSQRSIYIVPSKAGFLYAGVLFAMLVASINYQLSLGYALTFLLGATAIIGILHTYRNLTGITLRPGRAEPVFAGQLAEFSLMLVNPSKTERFAIHLTAWGMAKDELIDLPTAAEQLVSIALPTVRRGWLDLPRLKLWTGYPLGIWRAWAYWHPALRVLVYPTPETPAAPMPDNLAISADGNGSGKGDDDVAAIRPYQDGDSMRRIAWKAVARSASDNLLSKQFDGGDRGELLLDWRLLPAQLDTEARISRLTRWVIDAESSGTRYALNLPNEQIALDSGATHRQRCLEALAALPH
jgi:uncharacterized protein (DUF58 family)